jgi:hypothetical protein
METILVCENPACQKSFAVPAYRATHTNARFCSIPCYSVAMLLLTSERFWNKVCLCIHGNDCLYCCHEWTASRNPAGYGLFGVKEADGEWHSRLAPRIMWELVHNRRIPPSLNALHHCDNPPCVNGWHVYIDTHAKNAQDAQKRGRLRVGEERSCLTNEQVLSMRDLYRVGHTTTALGEQFGIESSAIWNILAGKHWKHLPAALDPAEIAILRQQHRPRGGTHWKAKMTEDQVREIRRLRHEGRSARTLAREFGISLTQTKDILRRKSWSHVL